MINISEIVNDPDFAQSFSLVRSSGTWTLGRFVSTSTTLSRYGVILPMTTKEITQLATGDALQGYIKVYCVDNIYTTRLDTAGDAGGLSDEVVWQGDNYKVLAVQQFSDFGYWQASCVRKRGA